MIKTSHVQPAGHMPPDNQISHMAILGYTIHLLKSYKLQKVYSIFSLYLHQIFLLNDHCPKTSDQSKLYLKIKMYNKPILVQICKIL